MSVGAGAHRMIAGRCALTVRGQLPAVDPLRFNIRLKISLTSSLHVGTLPHRQRRVVQRLIDYRGVCERWVIRLNSGLIVFCCAKVFPLAREPCGRNIGPQGNLQ